MASFVTDKMILKQMNGDYAGFLVAAGLTVAIAGVLAGICIPALGIANVVSILTLIALAASLVWLVILILKVVRIRQHPVFKRYGAPPFLAERISAGLSNPRYIVRQQEPFTTLMTNDFIVSGIEMIGFLELKDAVSVSKMTAGSIAANYATDKIMQANREKAMAMGNQPIDMITMKDVNGKTHAYGIRVADMPAFLNLLHELAPHITINM